MHRFSQLSLRRKLVLVMLVTSAVAVALTAGVLALHGWQQSRRTLVQRIQADADLLAANSAAALAFNDAKAAGEVLAALRVTPEIAQAWLYRADGTVLAGYDRGEVWPTPVPDTGQRLVSGYLLVFAPVQFGGDTVGRLGVLVNAAAHRRDVLVDLALAGGVILIALGLAFWVAVRLAGVVLAPVRTLTHASRRVITDKDYGLRVVRETDDEVGQLVDGFNEMLGVIQQREAELRDSEERFRSAFENAPMAMVVGDLEGRFQRVNAAACTLTGYTAAELLARTIFDVVPAADRARLHAAFEALLAGRVAQYDVEQQLVGKDGRVVWGRVGATLVRDAAGAPHRLLCQVQDISARKEAQHRLLEQQAQLRALVAAVPDLMFRVRADGTILDFHAHNRQDLYVPPDQIVGRRMAELLPAAAAENIGAALRRALATGVLQQVEYELPMPAGLQAYEGRLVKGGADEATMIVRNVTDRRRLERQLLEVSEHEQRRIGQDLHDGLCQQLVGMGFMVRLLEQRLQAAGSPQAADAQEIAGHLHQALHDARQVSHGLHPVRMDEEGLGLALRELAARVSQGGAVACEFDYPETVPVTDNNVATHLYRIAQEAVNNALKHGQPRHILISLVREDGALELRVEDDGVGLGEAPRVLPNGIGLQVMQYRARMIGGLLDVGPRSEGGTVVTCLCRP